MVFKHPSNLNHSMVAINNLCYCNTNQKRLKPEQHVAIVLLEVCLVHAVMRSKNANGPAQATKSSAKHPHLLLLLAINTFPAGCERWDNFTCSE